MYYGIVKPIPVKVGGVEEQFPQFFSYPSLEELLTDNPDVIFYYICDEDHRCELLKINKKIT